MNSQTQSETRIMTVVFLTILVGWIGFSLPYPVFGHLFLNPESRLLSSETDATGRSVLLGVAIALYPLGQIGGAIIFGRLSDRLGRVSVLTGALGVALAGAGMLWSGVAEHTLWLVLLGRFVAGLGEGNIAILQSLAADVSRPESKARNFALIGIAMDLGFVAGPILGGVLALSGGAEGMNFGAPFAAATALFALNLVIVPSLLRGRPVSSPRPARGIPAKPDAEPKLRIGRLLVLSFLTFWSVMVFFEFFPVYFVQQYGTPPLDLGINAALLSVPLILSGLCVGRLVNMIGARNVALLSFLLMGLGSYVFVSVSGLLAHAIPAVLVAVGINFGQTATSVLVSDAAPENAQGTAIGLYRAVTIAAGAIVGVLGGFLAAIDPAGPFLTGVAASVLAAVILIAGHKFFRTWSKVW